MLSEFARFQTKLVNEDVVSDAQKKVIDVKRAIYRSGVPRIIIKTLGGFQLFRDETPLEESDGRPTSPNSSSKRSSPTAPTESRKMF